MKKQILASLLILSPTFTRTMENDTWSLSSFSLSSFLPEWLSFNKVSNESKLISNLRRSKDDFENKLLSNKEEIKRVLKKQPLAFYLKVNHYPIWFLQYCYYQEIIKHLDENLTLIATFPFLKNMQINGYTALGAAIISREPSVDKKRSFIQKLLNSGFELIPKDLELAELALYDAIATHHKTLLHLLHAHSDVNWSVLPQEVRKQIAQYMLQLFKNELWLLPEKVLEGII